MNKRTKVGLILQIPNLIILLIFIIGFIILKVNWNEIFYSIPYILIGSTFALINIVSFIYLIVGVMEK